MKHSIKRATVIVPLLLCLLGLPGTVAATLITMDFEQIPDPDAPGVLVSDGFVLDPGARDWIPNLLPYRSGGPWVGHYEIADPTQSTWTANNGTSYFAWDYFLDNSVLNIYQLSGGVFGLQQFDIAESLYGLGTTCSDVPHPTAVLRSGITFTGYLANGGTITRRENFDLICDGMGQANDFQTFAFDGRWNHLTAFSIVPDYAYANPGLDNLVLRTVPEPATIVLVGIGIVGVLISRKRSGSSPASPHIQSRAQR